MTPSGANGGANVNALRREFEGRCSDYAEGSGKAPDELSVIIVGAGAFGVSLALELVTHYSDR